MHIEPGIVDGAKIVLSYATAGGVGAYATAQAWRHIKDRGITTLLGGTVATTALVLVFFEVLPHFPLGCRRSTSSWGRRCSCCSGRHRRRSARRWAC